MIGVPGGDRPTGVKASALVIIVAGAGEITTPSNAALGVDWLLSGSCEEGNVLMMGLGVEGGSCSVGGSSLAAPVVCPVVIIQLTCRYTTAAASESGASSAPCSMPTKSSSNGTTGSGHLERPASAAGKKADVVVSPKAP